MRKHAGRARREGIPPAEGAGGAITEKQPPPMDKAYTWWLPLGTVNALGPVSQLRDAEVRRRAARAGLSRCAAACMEVVEVNGGEKNTQEHCSTRDHVREV